MKVQDCMTSPAHSCTAQENLTGAAEIMWNYQIGALPVLDSRGEPIGMITDRDICMAVARKDRFPRDISVLETMSPNPFTVRPGDSIETALETMAARQIRRLPVVDDEGRLVGVVSINDIAAAIDSSEREWRGRPDMLSHIVDALRRITTPSPPPAQPLDRTESRKPPPI